MEIISHAVHVAVIMNPMVKAFLASAWTVLDLLTCITIIIIIAMMMALMLI